MRTLGEIIEDAKSGKMPSQEECYYALLVYEFLFNMDYMKIIEFLDPKRPRPALSDIMRNESFNRYKSALQKSPKDYVGWNNDPMNPEYQKLRQAESKLFDKLFEKVSKKEDKNNG